MCSQAHAKHLAGALWKLKQENMFCDTTIHAESGIEIYAHSAVLGAVSTKLKMELLDSSAWINGNGWNQSTRYQLHLAECKPVLLNAVLEYIYTGQLNCEDVVPQLNTVDVYTELVSLCDILGVDASSILPSENTDCHQEPQTTVVSRTSTETEQVGKYVEENSEHHDSVPDECHMEPDTSVVTSQNTGQLRAVMLKIPLGKSARLCRTLNPGSDDKSNLAENGYCENRVIADTTHQSKTSPTNSDLTFNEHNRKHPRIDRDVEEVAVKKENEGDDSKTVLTLKITRQRRNHRKVDTATRQLSNSFQCCLCSKTFIRKAHLQGHLKSHANERPYVCALCQKTFTQGSHLCRHYVMHCCETSSEREKDCKVEEKELARSEEIQRPYICKICKKGFAGESELEAHSVAHDDERRFQCSKCDKSFTRKAQLVKHEASHNDTPLLLCSTCNEGFHTTAELEEHVATHTGVQPHVCHVCGKRFALPENLKRHESIHLAKKTYHCKVCNKSFKCLSYLKSHQKGHDGIKPFMCDVCGKGFLGSSNLKTHRRIHTGERPYACRYCEKRFLQICAVKEHEKIHLGNKQFVCDTCGKMFMTYAQLYNHLKIHIGIKAFVCDICNKRFFTNGDMTKHQRIHKDNRPFVCNVCGKGFKYSSNLHGHSRIHSGTRPYVCKTCGKDFTYSSHLSRHSKLHTREKIGTEEKECTYLPVTIPSLQVPPTSQATIPSFYFDNQNAGGNLTSVFPVFTGYDMHL